MVQKMGKKTMEKISKSLQNHGHNQERHHGR
jgi:hypothetical protein